MDMEEVTSTINHFQKGSKKNGKKETIFIWTDMLLPKKTSQLTTLIFFPKVFFKIKIQYQLLNQSESFSIQHVTPKSPCFAPRDRNRSSQNDIPHVAIYLVMLGWLASRDVRMMGRLAPKRKLNSSSKHHFSGATVGGSEIPKSQVGCIKLCK